ncbi:MAG: hypothetical protein JWM33_1919 [Caulobacteraceae bacterium]|nr:hypothetical protein [Caulobacteraceae bacterium]
MIRLFAAIALPPEIAAGLVSRQEPLAGARWRPPESLHVTLRFFGEVAEDIADDIDQGLELITGAPFDLTIEGAGSFGEGDRLRALWAGVAPSQPLSVLAGRCERAARNAGLKPESRVFMPHVTLAYLKGADPRHVAAYIQAHNLLKSPPFRVEGFGLYSSWRSADTSVYRLERRYHLG